MSNRFSTSRTSRSRDSSAVSSSSAWSLADHSMSLLRRLVTAAFADASGLRRSCPTAASSATRIRSPSAMGPAAAAASLSRCRSRIAAAWAAKAPTTRWSSARSDRPRSPSVRVSPAGTWVSASCGRSHGSPPALATTVHSSAGPREAPGPGASRGPADEWTVVASAGGDPCERAQDADTQVPAGDTLTLGLRTSDIEWSPQDHAELLLTADESLDRLVRLVDNLLDMSRLQAGALSVVRRPVALDEVVPLALDDLGPAGLHIVVDVPDDLPVVLADPGLLERVIANLVGNAVRYSPPGSAPLLTGSSLGDRVELRVIDRGPGIPSADLDRIFTPFQRLGDTDNTTGVGLGLALSRGLSV